METGGVNVIAYYTQGQGLISQRRGNASYFYHYDGLGSTKALTDSNQNIQASYKYDAWGNVLQSSGTITNPYLYVGELGYYGDGDAGMYLLTQRWYNPVIGRFVVRDPGFKADTSSYTYTRSNPINYVDPLGLSATTTEPVPGIVFPQYPKDILQCIGALTKCLIKAGVLAVGEAAKAIAMDWKAYLGLLACELACTALIKQPVTCFGECLAIVGAAEAIAKLGEIMDRLCRRFNWCMQEYDECEKRVGRNPQAQSFPYPYYSTKVNIWKSR